MVNGENMQLKSLAVENAMALINRMILDINEKSVDRGRLSSKARLAVIKSIDNLMALDEEGFRKATERIFREELLAEIVRHNTPKGDGGNGYPKR